MTKTLGDRLRIERTRLSLNQSEAADALGVGRSAYVHYEFGRSVPDANALMKAQSLGMDLWWIVTGVRHADEAIDHMNLEALKSVTLAVTDFNKSQDLKLTSEQENELIRVLYKQFVQLGANSNDDLKTLLMRAAA
ncbi:MAG: helix-turn-helix domain-containing protein [Pseudomonadota bacterium]